MTTQPAPVPATSNSLTKRVLPASPVRAGLVIVSFTAALYLISLVNWLGFHWDLRQYGIDARSLSGLPGIVWAPLLHGGWAHLFGNTIPVLIFGFLAMAVGIGPWIASTVLIWLVSGIGVWLTGSGVTIGASGIAFGWLAFLLVRGLFNRSFGQIIVAIVLLFFWGSTLFGLIPGLNPGISWQAHLFGALGGVLAAWLAAKAAKAGKRKSEESAPTTISTP
ncbi:rhomboid family intramembrane serine protease [Sciscionella marina]|uniref:rhomboid family intramembrane serine protease n=1 Tax=Sciscionella marina TaxID=508770 RepID=UPI0003710699|nr:rhomboid family intramembrane serine protease [Sciscionella marina]